MAEQNRQFLLRERPTGCIDPATVRITKGS
jgi:hypothetical protein